MSQAGQGSAKRQKLRHVDIQALSPVLDKEAPLVATFASGNAAAMTAQDLQYEVYETAEGVRPKHRMLICPRVSCTALYPRCTGVLSHLRQHMYCSIAC